ncbi:MAG: 6-bladed beta-propeller [Balneola sp.]
MKHLVITLLGLFIVTCDKKEAINNLPVSTNHIEIRVNPLNAKNVDIKSLVKNHSYLKLEIPDSLYFSSIEKIIFDDGNIYMLDKSNFQDQILSFDLEGNFNFHINRPGRGPGEFETIYDFDIEGKSVLISTTTGLKFYDKRSGTYLRTILNSEKIQIQNFKMMDTNILVAEVGRFKSNISKKQLRVLNLEKGEVILEAVPFETHALKGSHSNRYFYNFGDSLSVTPIYDQTIFRIFKDTLGAYVKPAYEVNFGEYWVPRDILAASYKDRGTFFSEIGDYVSIFEAFETDNKMYIHYKYSGENYALLYDKKDKDSKNLKLISNNELGWFGAPVATYKNSIVNTITVQKEAEYTPRGKKGSFQQFFSSPNEQNTLVLLFIELE